MHIDSGYMTGYATWRHEDAIVLHGVRNVMEVAHLMPSRVWGELEWSAEWARSWEEATDWRRLEATEARDAFFDTSDAVLQALATYTQTDIKAAGDISEAMVDGLGPYMEHRTGPGGEYDIGTYKPGGSRTSVRDPAPGTTPRGKSELHGIYAEICPPALDDPLQKLMTQHGDLLAEAEAFCRKYRDAGEDTDFYTPYLLAAWKTDPNTIEAYGEETLLAAEAHQKIKMRLKRDNALLPDAWSGHGGSVFAKHATTLLDYVNLCYTEAKTLGKGAKDAAGVIRRVRNSLAVAGREGVDRVLWRYQMVNDLAGTYAFFGGNKADVASLLVNAAKDLVNQYVQGMRDQQEEAKGVVPAHQAADRMPDLNSHAYLPNEMPDTGYPKADDWRHPTTW